MDNVIDLGNMLPICVWPMRQPIRKLIARSMSSSSCQLTPQWDDDS